jgi:hypothetical protein
LEDRHRDTIREAQDLIAKVYGTQLLSDPYGVPNRPGLFNYIRGLASHAEDLDPCREPKGKG